MAKHKKSQDVLEPLEIEHWLNDDDMFDNKLDFFHGINQFVNSAIELTRVVLDAEQKQKALTRDDIFDIYSQSINVIAKSLTELAGE